MSRPTARRLRICALILLAACSDPAPEPAATGSRFLLERLAGAALYLRDGGSSAPIGQVESDADGGVWLAVELAAPAGWERLSEPRARALGLRHPSLAAWYFDVVLPAQDADGISFQLGDRALERWQKPLPPAPFSAFYQPGGFVRRGVYLALPPEFTPESLEIRARFRPEATALVEHQIATRTPFAAVALQTHARRGATTRPSLFLPPGLAVGFPLVVPADCQLRFGLARTPRPSAAPAGSAGSGGALRIAFRSGADRAAPLEQTFPFDSADAEVWQEFRMDLSGVAGRSGELVFELIDAGPAHGLHYVGDPVLAAPNPPAGPNLVLIVVDGLRADRLGRAELTPQLGRMAGSGLGFSAARSAAPWTRPSIASLFTGLPPSVHGVEREQNSDVLGPGPVTLAERLRRSGYATAAISANLHLDPAFGLHRGFGFHRARLDDGRGINEAAFGWLDDRLPGPFFLFLFYMDTHYPFRHRPEHDLSSTLPGSAPTKAQMSSEAVRRRNRTPDPTAEQLEQLEALYDENVRYADERIRDVMEGLRARNLAADTLVVVTADHGEAFGEHGDLFHGWNLHDELLRVPLVVAGAPLAQSGRRDTPVSLADVPASLLALLAIGDEALPGRSDLFTGSAPLSPQPVYAESRFRATSAAAIVEDGHKLIWQRAGGAVQLFDLRADPGEQRDLRGEQPERAEALAAELRAWLDANALRRVRTTGSAPAATVSPETEEQLRSLGYLP